MRHKTVQLACDAPRARVLATALRAYAEAAYPRGGSDCAQVARAALLDAADECEAHTGGPMVLRKRLLPQLRAAVRYYLSEQGAADVESAQGLASVLSIDTRGGG